MKLDRAWFYTLFVMAFFWGWLAIAMQRATIAVLALARYDSGWMNRAVVVLAFRCAAVLSEMHDHCPGAHFARHAHELRRLARKYHGGPYAGWL